MSERILLAEDNTTNQMVVVRLLEKTGYRIDPVANGIEALKALAPSTLFQQAGSGREDFDRMAELVRSVPIYLLSVSRNGEIERTIAQLLATVAGNTP